MNSCEFPGCEQLAEFTYCRDCSYHVYDLKEYRAWNDKFIHPVLHTPENQETLCMK